MWRWVLVLLVGCNQVYGLDQTKQRDPETLPDGDGDGVADVADNCPDRANAAQSDSDGDLRGDVCDECPLLLGPAGGDADLDGIGDACDPNPEQAGDCLAIVDTFVDPGAFASHWEVTGSTIAVEPGRVVVTAPTDMVTLAERSTSGTRGSVTVLGHALADDPLVVALVGQQANNRYGCRLDARAASAEGPGVGLSVLASLVPEQLVGNDFTVRLDTTLDAQAKISVRCRVDYGVSVATQVRPDQPVIAGPAGIQVASGTASIEAVAIVTSQAGACTTEYR